MKIIIASTQKHFFDALSIRQRVFVDEQQVPSAIEIDDYDRTCLHILLYDGPLAKAVCRLIEQEDGWKVGRVAVLKEDRHHGYGSALMLGLENLENVKAKGRLELDAQMTAIGFYQALGYTIGKEAFEEAGIMHKHAYKHL